MSEAPLDENPMKAGPLRVAAMAALAFVAALFGITAALGGFAPLAIAEREVGPLAFVYHELYGADFAQIAQLSAEVGERLERAGVAASAPMAVFYGDSLGGERPNEAGVLLDVEAIARVSELIENDAGNPPLQVRRIEPAQAMTTSFPRSGTIAYMVGYFRAESVLGEYRTARRYRREPLHVIVREDRIEYVQPAVPN